MRKKKPAPLSLPVVTRLVRAGMTDSQIAKATGHTRNYAKCFRYSHGLPANPEKRQLKLNPDKVKALVAKGWQGYRIAEKYGVSKTCVYDCLKRYGIQPAHKAGRPRKKVNRRKK